MQQVPKNGPEDSPELGPGHRRERELEDGDGHIDDQREPESSPMTTLTLTGSLNSPRDKSERSGVASLGSLASPGRETREGSEYGEGSVEQLPVDQLDDHGLLAATREGDELAFQEIVRRYRNAITNFIYRMLNDYDRAVDLAQETFVRIYMNVERYQATYSFSTYIYRIASNLAISEIRQRKRRRMVPIPTFYSDKQNEEFDVDLPDTRQVTAEQTLIDDERRLAVSRAIASLPEKYRTVVVLRALKARVMRKQRRPEPSDGTVKSQSIVRAVC
jgi:RNA polymerase sigma-70 factor (ECF subfamily)